MGTLVRDGRRARVGEPRQEAAAVPAPGDYRVRRHGRRKVRHISKGLARALGKPHVRVLAIDDGPFSRRQRWAPLAAVVVSTPNEIDGFAASWVRVDGTDATEAIISLGRQSSLLEGARVVLLDGAAVGGFNVVDVDDVVSALDRPVITVTRRRPDFDAIRAALLKYFPRDGRARFQTLRRHRLFPVPTRGAPIFATAVGCSRKEAVALLQRLQRRGYWPEPLRLAHIFARAVAAGRLSATLGDSARGANGSRSDPIIMRRASVRRSGP